MKRETKLWLRKRALMTLRAIVWRLDEWIHAQETKLREEIELRADPKQSEPAGNRDRAATTPHARQPETFKQWEARKSGVAVISKKESRRRERLTAADFDRRFA